MSLLSPTSAELTLEAIPEILYVSRHDRMYQRAVLCYEIVSVGMNEPLVDISLSVRKYGLSHHTGKVW